MPEEILLVASGKVAVSLAQEGRGLMSHRQDGWP